ncbi:RNB domain-containing ribonuclease [uncultured Microbacterium sp.]|uniref:RNB domain-containing ribonuclease n=1 Tax=uncultured Microbacterium sp. TaxID=191216 RepID=UPI0035CC12F2
MPARRPRIVRADTDGALDAALADLRRQLELPGDFPPEAETEAQAAARTVSVDPAVSGLDDLRDIEFLTIDPAGSTDLDQAMHLERTATGAVLHYAIADVPAFVRPGGGLDAEARVRGQTLYAADGRIPLHPVAISEDAASLLPGRDRRAYVWRFVLDDGARPVKTTIRRAVIRSRAQWTYVDAQVAVDTGTAPPTLMGLAWFGPLRAERESERGGASLNLAETRVVEAAGRYRLEREASSPVEDWNSQVSLLTGMAAAEIMLRGGIGILRTMPVAARDDVVAFRAQTVALGDPWRADTSYGDYLRGLDRGAPATLAILEAAASLFRGAGYVAFDGESPADPVQSAIAAPYAHTTAPLRRLVDRWSLVICEALANEHPVPAWARESLAQLPRIMGRSDARAGRLDAGTIDRVEAALMTGHEGEVFDGVVIAHRAGAARVELTDPPVSAKVAGLDAPAGSTVRLRLVSADIAAGTVTLEPAEEPALSEGATRVRP